MKTKISIVCSVSMGEFIKGCEKHLDAGWILIQDMAYLDGSWIAYFSKQI